MNRAFESTCPSGLALVEKVYIKTTTRTETIPLYIAIRERTFELLFERRSNDHT